MAFAKKPKIAAGDTRPQGTRMQQREQKIKALRAENTPEARKALKKMNDVTYRGGRSNLKDWYKPNGKGITCKP
mgnify:CR=1 FL=1